MTFDVPHMVATAVIIFVVIWGLDQTKALDKMSNRRKILVKFGVLFAAIFILNIVLPYRS